MTAGFMYSMTWVASLAFVQLAVRQRTPVRLVRFLEDCHGRLAHPGTRRVQRDNKACSPPGYVAMHIAADMRGNAVAVSACRACTGAGYLGATVDSRRLAHMHADDR